MKKIKSFGLLVAVILFLFDLLSCINVMEAEAGDYIGECCWHFTITTNGSQASGTLQLGISHLGGDHYLCSGIIAVKNPIVFQLPTFGNVEFIGNKIIVTLSDQGRRYENAEQYTIGIDMSTITLDAQTLNGSFEGIGVYSEKTETSTGTVTFSTCQ